MKSMTKVMVVAIAMLIAAALLVAPAAAVRGTDPAGPTSLTDINISNTIFVYETGLNLRGLEPSVTLFAAPAAADAIVYLKHYDGPVTTAAVTNTITVSNPASFSVLASDVNGIYGTYYAWNGSGLMDQGFGNRYGYVEIVKPSLTLNVVLNNSYLDSVNGGSVTKDNVLTFKIINNIAAAFNTTAPQNTALLTGFAGLKTVNIEVTSPVGGVSTMFGGVNLVALNLSPSSTVYSGEDPTIAATQALTLGGNCSLSNVAAGDYSATAKWIAASPFYKDGVDSNAVTFSVLSKAIAITADKDTVIRGNPFSVTITGQSVANYYLYIKTASVGTNTYPGIELSQPGVTINSALAAAITDEAGTDGTFALVGTKADGTRTVQFNTSATTKDITFEIKAADQTSPAQKYDSVKVKVEKGALTIAYEGTGTYYIGEEIKLSGTNTDTEVVYLYMTGPNLAVNGVLLTDSYFAVGVTPGDGLNWIDTKTVETDNTWTFKWDTGAALNKTDAGTYTIYAVNAQDKKDELTSSKYATTSVVLKKPFITASVSNAKLAKGDKQYVEGIAEGQPTTVYVWFFGKNYRNLFNSVSVASDGSFDYDGLGRAATVDLAAGQYFLVVQHPMMNGIADIEGTPVGVTGTTILNSTDTRCPIANPAGQGSAIWVKVSSLEASAAATALITALDSPDIDDTYRKVSFMVEEPWVAINTIGDQHIGTGFDITGTTNLAAADTLIITVTSASFGPTVKTQDTAFSGASGSVAVVAGDTTNGNTWSFSVGDGELTLADNYIVTLECVEVSQATATTTFNVLEPGATPPPTEVPPTEVPPTEVPPTEVPPTQTPGFGALVALIGLGAVAALVLRRD